MASLSRRKRLTARLGRRGAFLVSLGLAWVAYGFAFLATSRPAAQREGLTVLSRYVSHDAQGFIWLACGIVAVIFGCVWRVGDDQIGFTALIAPSALWSISYFADWVLVSDYSRGWVVAVTYAAISAAIYIASGWPEVRQT